mgnify:CR=1 FL=1
MFKVLIIQYLKLWSIVCWKGKLYGFTYMCWYSDILAWAGPKKPAQANDILQYCLL